MLKEQEIAQALINGGLSGVVCSGEYAYLPLRFTGTGIMERIDDDGNTRQVNRRFEDFTTPELMKEYANINILFTHPKDNEGNCVRAGLKGGGLFIGNTIASYLKGEEVWVIARLHNAEVVDFILKNSKEQNISTSPHIASDEVLEDGVFIEIPTKINHLAIVEEGFWDSKSTAPAVEGDTLTFIKEDDMSENIDNMERNLGAEPVIEPQKVDKADEPQKTEDKPDEKSVEDKVADLENHEAKEAEQFKELAKEHDTLDKGDLMDKVDKEVDKRELIKEAMAVASENPKDFKGGDDEKAREEAKIAEKLAYDDSLADKHDEDIVSDETYTDEDKGRDSMVRELTDKADEKLVIPYGHRWTTVGFIKKFAKANPDLVDEKYKGLIDKADSSNKALMQDAYKDMLSKIDARLASAEKAVKSQVSGGIFNGTRFSDI